MNDKNKRNDTKNRVKTYIGILILISTIIGFIGFVVCGYGVDIINIPITFLGCNTGFMGIILLQNIRRKLHVVTMGEMRELLSWIKCYGIASIFTMLGSALLGDGVAHNSVTFLLAGLFLLIVGWYTALQMMKGFRAVKISKELDLPVKEEFLYKHETPPCVTDKKRYSPITEYKDPMKDVDKNHPDYDIIEKVCRIHDYDSGYENIDDKMHIHQYTEILPPYKCYYSSIRWDNNIKGFVGHVVGFENVAFMNYMAKTFKEFEDCFHKAVDIYYTSSR